MSNRPNRSKKSGAKSPLLEWIFGTIGLVLTLSILGFVGWQALTQGEDLPPRIDVRVERVSPADGSYVVEIVAHNRSSTTAKSVEVEGVLAPRSGQPETRRVTFDYVPGGSTVRGGLHFLSDPATGKLHLRALGHARP